MGALHRRRRFAFPASSILSFFTLVRSVPEGLGQFQPGNIKLAAPLTAQISMATLQRSFTAGARPRSPRARTSCALIIFFISAGGGCGAARDGSDTGAAGKGVVADRFEIHYALKAGVLTLSLDTDLPDEAKVMVDVSRRYWQVGDTTAYVNEYFEEGGPISDWRTPRPIVLDEDRWRASLSEKQRILAQGGDPFEIGRVEDTVSVSFVVPINQPDPRFGDRNQHLRGKAVRMSSMGWPLIERELRLAGKAGNVDASAPRWADPGNLRVGRRYALSRGTSLMPELHPLDPIGAIERIRVIPEGGTIQIASSAERQGTRWYEVEAYGELGERLGTGWVNSTALIGQDVKEVR
jgi:hypothetical protein